MRTISIYLGYWRVPLVLSTVSNQISKDGKDSLSETGQQRKLWIGVGPTKITRNTTINQPWISNVTFNEKPHTAICLCFISEPSLLCNFIWLWANKCQLHCLSTLLNTVLKRKRCERYYHRFINEGLVISSECVRIDAQFLKYFWPFPSDQPTEPLLFIHD